MLNLKFTFLSSLLTMFFLSSQSGALFAETIHNHDVIAKHAVTHKTREDPRPDSSVYKKEPTQLTSEEAEMIANKVLASSGLNSLNSPGQSESTLKLFEFFKNKLMQGTPFSSADLSVLRTLDNATLLREVGVRDLGSLLSPFGKLSWGDAEAIVTELRKNNFDPSGEDQNQRDILLSTVRKLQSIPNIKNYFPDDLTESQAIQKANELLAAFPVKKAEKDADFNPLDLDNNTDDGDTSSLQNAQISNMESVTVPGDSGSIGGSGGYGDY